MQIVKERPLLPAFGRTFINLRIIFILIFVSNKNISIVNIVVKKYILYVKALE